MAKSLIIWLLLSAGSIAATLDELALRLDLWNLPRADFVTASQGMGFHWVSETHEAAETTEPGLKLFGLAVYQVVARFKADKVEAITVSFYNRGDAGDLARDKFQALLRQSTSALTAATKTPPVVRGKDAASAVKAEGVQWQSAATKFLLEYSFTREQGPTVPFRAEFVRLSLSPIEKPQNLLASALAEKKPAEKFNGPAHVKRDLASGDVVLEGVPMVDQGDKGYCVVASAERVLRYYGVSTDQNELAQMANSSATAGTSPAAMIDSLKKLAGRLRVKARTVEAFEVPQILALVNNYNLAARREKEALIDTSSRMLNVSSIFQAMKPELLLEVRNKNRSDANRFLREVQARIDTGVPLLWSVMLGLFPEPKGPTGFGGHMRLIIGYNSKTNELLYTDSWGLGHELKRMPLAQAWAITTGMDAIEPL